MHFFVIVVSRKLVQNDHFFKKILVIFRMFHKIWSQKIPQEVLIMRLSFLGNHISKICSKFSLLISFFKTKSFFFSYILRASEYNNITVCRYLVHYVMFLMQTHVVNVLLFLCLELLKFDYRIMSEKWLTVQLNFF